MAHTICYFDVNIGSEAAGRITFELFDDVVPKVSPDTHHITTVRLTGLYRLQRISNNYV